jgi:photosystem II stability/assembly factor-like uncharacterized protein
MVRKGVTSVLIAAAAGLALLALASPASGGLHRGRSAWQWGNPVPQGHTLRSVELDGSTGYAVGDFGTLLRADDGGSTWTALSTGITTDLQRIVVIGPDSLVVAGRCVLRRSDDGGLTFRRLPWTANEKRCPAPIAAAAFAGSLRGYLVLADGSLLRTDDGGAHWTAQAPIPSPLPTGMAFTSADAGVVTTSGGLIYRTADGGASWGVVHAGPHGLRDVSFAGPAIGYAVGDASTVLRTSDAGRTWTMRSSGIGPTLDSIRCASGPACLATTEGGLLRTADGGKTLVALASTSGVHGVSFGVGSRAVGVGEGGGIVISDDDGAGWSGIGSRLPGALARLRATSPTLAFGAGPEGRLARSLDGGRTWGPIGTPTQQDITDVSFTSKTTGYALDLAGQVFRTGDGGTSWLRLRPGFPARPQALLALRDVVLLVGPHGILRSHDGGRTFASVRSRAARRAKLFDIDRAGRALFAFGSRRIAVSMNRGRSWKTVRRPRRALIESVDFVSPRTGFLLEQDGRLWRTDDRGRRWRDLAGTGSDDGIGMAFSSGATGYVAISHFGAEAGGYLLHTTNGGRTWRPELLTDSPIAGAGLVARGGTALALATDGSIFYDDASGRAGDTIRLETPRRVLRRLGTIRVTGTVPGAEAGMEVLVGRRLRGESGWDHKIARVGPGGRFTTAWTMTRTATFVAQWIGDSYYAGRGSRALRVTVRRR